MGATWRHAGKEGWLCDMPTPSYVARRMPLAVHGSSVIISLFNVVYCLIDHTDAADTIPCCGLQQQLSKLTMRCKAIAECLKLFAPIYMC
jgi:hypothetical protein